MMFLPEWIEVSNGVSQGAIFRSVTFSNVLSVRLRTLAITTLILDIANIDGQQLEKVTIHKDLGGHI